MDVRIVEIVDFILQFPAGARFLLIGNAFGGEREFVINGAEEAGIFNSKPIDVDVVRVASGILFKRIVHAGEGEDVGCACGCVFEGIPRAESALDGEGILLRPFGEINPHAVDGDENLVVYRRAALQIDADERRFKTLRYIIKWKFKAHLAGIAAIFDAIPIPEVQRLEPRVFVAAGDCMRLEKFEVTCQFVFLKRHGGAERWDLRRCRIAGTRVEQRHARRKTGDIHAEPIDIPTGIRVICLFAQEEEGIGRIKTSIACTADEKGDFTSAVPQPKGTRVCADELNAEVAR